MFQGFTDGVDVWEDQLKGLDVGHSRTLMGLPAQSIPKASSPMLGQLSNYIVKGEVRSAKSVKGYSSPMTTDNQGQLFQSHATGYNSSKNN